MEDKTNCELCGVKLFFWSRRERDHLEICKECNIKMWVWENKVEEKDRLKHIAEWKIKLMVKGE